MAPIALIIKVEVYSRNSCCKFPEEASEVNRIAPSRTAFGISDAPSGIAAGCAEAFQVIFCRGSGCILSWNNQTLAAVFENERTSYCL